MIQITHEGASWNVRRDGEYIQAAGSAGVFLTKESAIEYARSISECTGEEVRLEDGEADRETQCGKTSSEHS